jgi:curli production assembly/transport component CsgG|tara:strand:+ start:1836 stop:2672 length:837 start_codon:yes stop_codon:yes gene_type:complete
VQSLFKSLVILCLFVLAGCAVTPNEIKYYEELGPFHHQTPTNQLLRELPHLDNEIMTIAVYSFTDKTGQRKPSQKFSQLSTAVSQGPEVWVIQALKEAGDGTWFKVVERGGLDNLVKERQLIRSTRESYEGQEANKNSLKPLLFAGLILEGGIVSYDSNIDSGGFGARYFGIGAHEEYRVDQVTVSMRVVAVQTGEVILAVNGTKTIASHKSGVDAFRFIDMGTRAIEVESGVAENEPVNYAIRSAVEYCIIEIIKQGEQKSLWNFKEEINEPNEGIH